MSPLRGISVRYTLFIASILLAAMGLVLLLAGYFVFEGTNSLRADLTESFSSVQIGHDIDALRASGAYLGDRLFDPLYALDVSALNEEIARIESWLSPDSVLILDADGGVVTDGTRENPEHGRRYPLPGDLSPGAPLVETVPSGRLVYFTIGYGEAIIGYARIALSNARNRVLLQAMHTRVAGAWQSFVRRFVSIAWISVLVTVVVSLLIGWRLSVSLSRPLRDMNRVVEQYAAGNLEHKLPERSHDELGRLARSLNQMASQQERARDQLMLLANYDNLTRLPNRHLFYDRLRLAIAKAKRGRCQVALFFLDLDRFKEINDALGHDVGDELLSGVAARLSAIVRDTDTLARMGGDEFTLIVEGILDDRPLHSIARKMIDAFGPPFAIAGRQLVVSVSIGIAIYPHDAERLETLIKHADTAMYAAKALGPGHFRFFTRELQEIAHRRLALAHVLRRAVDRHELDDRAS
ncbi:diguanylate cyclase domain-containing protein [Imhoffiella purpurea]|uniref:Diguanylate cyclase n=1 Tax=Imhoffiella purpurea TaxID=1249627 RepID=W9V960_9GAMM|nr:diguanylate cyclase [Imhoffiella purpurea]EXJ12617.1 diguanylate cyclase [Imhoffiella purpurea]